MKVAGGIVAFAVVVCLMGADRAEPEPAKPPKADVRGEVKNVAAVDAKAFIGRMLVEGKKEADTGHDKASVTILRGAKIQKWVGGKAVDAKFEDIKPGCKVQCVFTGPVAESYPVQARTKEILILECPKK
jgi:beta-N-acetylhexosaminidase